jgi:hypothetical protein
MSKHCYVAKCLGVVYLLLKAFSEHPWRMLGASCWSCNNKIMQFWPIKFPLEAINVNQATGVHLQAIRRKLCLNVLSAKYAIKVYNCILLSSIHLYSVFYFFPFLFVGKYKVKLFSQHGKFLLFFSISLGLKNFIEDSII